MLMAVEIRVCLAIDLLRQTPGTVFAFKFTLFLFLAKQTPASERHRLGGDSRTVR
jgi:hypothetical protein